MANPVRILYSPTSLNAPTLGIGALDNNIGLNGPDNLFFYFDGTTTQSFNLTIDLLLDHVAGVLTASSAIVVDAASKIDVLNVDNLTLNGNTLSTTDVNGDLLLSPNGTGGIDATSSTIKNVLDPVAAQDAATKSYVDSVGIGLRDFKNSVLAASTANVNLAATTGGALQDGVTVTDGKSVLLKDQTAGAENGIYTAVTAANPSTWVRRTDANVSAEVTSGMFLFVTEGTVSANTGWILSTNDPIVLNTTALTFVQFSGAGTTTGTAGRITVTGTQIDIDASYVGQTSIITLGTVTTGTWQGAIIDQAFGGTGADLTALAAGALIKNNAGGTAFEAAVAGTDYLTSTSLIGGQTF